MTDSIAQQAVLKFRQMPGFTPRGEDGEEDIGAEVAEMFGGRALNGVELNAAQAWLKKNQITSAFAVWQFSDGSYAYTCTSCFHLRADLYSDE